MLTRSMATLERSRTTRRVEPVGHGSSQGTQRYPGNGPGQKHHAEVDGRIGKEDHQQRLGDHVYPYGKAVGVLAHPQVGIVPVSDRRKGGLYEAGASLVVCCSRRLSWWLYHLLANLLKEPRGKP